VVLDRGPVAVVVLGEWAGHAAQRSAELVARASRM
jgi:hypothetical protein